MRKRLGIISLFTILFAAFIIIWNYSYQTGLKEAYITIKNADTYKVFLSENKVFDNSELALDYASMPIDENYQRTLETYYNNRAYYGAPPFIPHPVKEERSMGGNTCLQCHQNGGFVAKFEAYAPVTPHPEMINCRQCHVAKTSETLFVQTAFTKEQAPKVGVNNALPGSPPMIPHPIQMRENCLACHAGPAAPKEIRVTHPERINCMQCHVLNNTNGLDTATFIRDNKNYDE
ncbi:nitrate reductase cytochrome c-type subunit [Aquimarina sp. 2201CG5-10]|uniref:nitrate reductase cytochrome c-type subunit n=1 Tax=Aquimarina callyspongiae TaxID=3098150 RepID=UPI002AB4F494|nr:nitrate reductase cytochrome c-type subunit [Aquimarina sp. 2201CG5-10]MDY8134920.1 nitrate reductase cytochrome c-type subunit [Aquimarina sp. 2201CG5-10]